LRYLASRDTQLYPALRIATALVIHFPTGKRVAAGDLPIVLDGVGLDVRAV
jgi:hypothetical protein